MNYPDISPNLGLRSVQVTESEVMSWNTIDDLAASHEEGQVIFVPDFIEGDSASLIYSKRGHYAHVGSVEIHKVFDTEQEAWEEACYDAINASGSENSIDHIQGTIEVACAAQALLNSIDWWTNR